MSETDAPTPATPAELLPALALVEKGDFRQAARELTRLRASALTPETRAAVDELQARISPDPRALWFGLAALLMLAWMVGAYVL